MPTPTHPHADLRLNPRPKRLTRSEFQRAVEHGAYDNPEKLELIDGEVFERMTQYSNHYTALHLCADYLRNAFSGIGHVRVQAPLDISPWHQPEPDLAVVSGSPRLFAHQHPSTALIVVEVADSSLRYDRTRKATVYAEARIPEYWIINLLERVIEVHLDPKPGADGGGEYLTTRVMGKGDLLQPLQGTGAPILVKDLLP